MTQISKQILTILILVLAGAGGALAQVDRMLTDPLTGIAMEGFDPVSYFTESQPLEGIGDYELLLDGVSWYFSSEANREAFRRAPEVYTPQYAGHGAMGVARGYLSRGNPRIWTLFNQRLYFFYSAANREAFLQAPERAVVDGLEQWPQLSR
jgi:YHS domain-containing protein